MRQKLRAQTASQITESSQKITTRLSEIAVEWKNVTLFLAQPQEPNLDEFARILLKKRARVFAPHARDDETFFGEIAPDWSNIFFNACGWREAREYSRPKASNGLTDKNMSAIILPGLAFDLQGHRLGQGGGWYDRALENFPAGVLRVGVCFDFQIIANVPSQVHDQRVEIIVTEKRVVFCSGLPSRKIHG